MILKMIRNKNLQLSKYDKLWLEELYKLINENKRPSYRLLRAKLYEQLPENYNPENIDDRLAKFQGQEITLEGVEKIDPKMHIITKSNEVINAVRQLLLNNPEQVEIKVAEIANITQLSERDVSLVLRLVSPYGRFWNSASSSQEFIYGFTAIRIENDNEIFNQYLYFKDIRELMNKSYLEASKKRGTHAIRLSNNNFGKETQSEIHLNPIFKSKIDRVDEKLCFVLMPFREIWSEEIYKSIRSIIESLGFQCLRADNLNGPIIIEDIWTKINQAGFIIADVTGKNPNVMYEVGIAHTVGRPTILLTQEIKEIPFDFTHLRHIEYKNSMSGTGEFKKKLREAIDEIQKIHNNHNILKNENYISSKLVRRKVK
jgi:hypothetical protein